MSFKCFLTCFEEKEMLTLRNVNFDEVNYIFIITPPHASWPCMNYIKSSWSDKENQASSRSERLWHLPNLTEIQVIFFWSFLTSTLFKEMLSHGFPPKVRFQTVISKHQFPVKNMAVVPDDNKKCSYGVCVVRRCNIYFLGFFFP